MPTEYTYEDSSLHTAFGNVTVEDKEAKRGFSAEWDVNAKAKILASPQAGRFIVGIVPLVPDYGEKEPLPSFPARRRTNWAKLPWVTPGYNRSRNNLCRNSSSNSGREFGTEH